ncbi:hypothetical protein JOS77_23500 [Chromobacterium haemolyticum]|nr:hypothetical protein JOS77_23500 [Chromobacterium haemolyticum]
MPGKALFRPISLANSFHRIVQRQIDAVVAIEIAERVIPLYGIDDGRLGVEFGINRARRFQKRPGDLVAAEIGLAMVLGLVVQHRLQQGVGHEGFGHRRRRQQQAGGCQAA